MERVSVFERDREASAQRWATANCMNEIDVYDECKKQHDFKFIYGQSALSAGVSKPTVLNHCWQPTCLLVQ